MKNYASLQWLRVKQSIKIRLVFEGLQHSSTHPFVHPSAKLCVAVGGAALLKIKALQPENFSC